MDLKRLFTRLFVKLVISLTNYPKESVSKLIKKRVRTVR